MIRSEQYEQALRALQRLIVHAKSTAQQTENDKVAELLNDMELLPECFADEQDKTEEFTEMLDSIGQMHPSCQYIVEEYQSAASGAA